MSEQSEAAQTYVDAAAENLSNLPASQPAEYTANKRFLTKDKTVHQLLGGGRGEVMFCSHRARVPLRFGCACCNFDAPHFCTLQRDLHRSGSSSLLNTVVVNIPRSCGF